MHEAHEIEPLSRPLGLLDIKKGCPMVSMKTINMTAGEDSSSCVLAKSEKVLKHFSIAS
jgi:hypothetical protein